MKQYPWLIKHYKNIIRQHQIKKSHHAILIKTQKGMGEFKLICLVSQWLLCWNPIKFQFCEQCHGCQLMSSNCHPDWHHIISKKNNIFDIDSIRSINQKIFTCAQQGKSKVIILSNIKKLTEPAANAFLKTLEEPPKNTWFFLIDYNDCNLYITIKSRCLIYNLFIPSEEYSLAWLKTKNTKKNYKEHLTALRISNGSPLSAKKLLTENIWIDRVDFFKNLLNAIQCKNLLDMLPVINQKNVIYKINWMCFLLFDAIKLNFKENQFLINLDQIKLIKYFSSYSNNILDKSIRSWMHCKFRLINIPGINYELLLLEQLLSWEKNLKFMSTH